jgi:hypothetical protein
MRVERPPRTMERRKEHEMLDFTEGWTWFLAGLGVTCLVVVIFFAAHGVGMWSEQDRGHPHGT